MDIDDNGPEDQISSAPQSKLPRLARGKTPEPSRVIQISHHTTNGQANGHSHAAAVALAPHLARDRSATPGSPGGQLNSFDWDDLETRFEKALADANQNEQALLDEFEDLIKYFNVWASTASTHDNERAAKRYRATRCLFLKGISRLTRSRLQTRTHFVKLKETDLASKRQHCKFHLLMASPMTTKLDLLTAPGSCRRVCRTSVPERDGVAERNAGVIIFGPPVLRLVLEMFDDITRGVLALCCSHASFRSTACADRKYSNLCFSVATVERKCPMHVDVTCAQHFHCLMVGHSVLRLRLRIKHCRYGEVQGTAHMKSLRPGTTNPLLV